MLVELSKVNIGWRMRFFLLWNLVMLGREIYFEGFHPKFDMYIEDGRLNFVNRKKSDRKATIKRKTKETDITLELNIDGK